MREDALTLTEDNQSCNSKILYLPVSCTSCCLASSLFSLLLVILTLAWIPLLVLALLILLLPVFRWQLKRGKEAQGHAENETLILSKDAAMASSPCRAHKP